MKRPLLVILGCLLPAALIAAEAQPQITLSVSLAASPAGQVTLGSQVTLHATAAIQPKEFPKWGVIQQHIHYTFSAQRTSPSPDTVAIATNVLTKTVTWSPQNAGVYEISVRATYITPSGRPSLDDRRLAPFATASLPNYKVLPAPTGPDLVPVTGTWAGECGKQDCTQCPYTTIPIYVKNSGNVTVAKQITVIVKYKDQVIQTWTTTAPAAGTQVKVGSYTTFLWNCPVITEQVTSTNYSVTVDATNAVAETNEQNNVKAFWLRFPEKTTFQGN
jgi:CARDB